MRHITALHSRRSFGVVVEATAVRVHACVCVQQQSRFLAVDKTYISVEGTRVTNAYTRRASTAAVQQFRVPWKGRRSYMHACVKQVVYLRKNKYTPKVYL